jgi:hypothetical protein
LNLQELVSNSGSCAPIPGIVLGSARSVKIVKDLDFSGIRIGVGDMPWRAPELGPYDFWVTANTEYPLPWKSRDLKDISKANCRLLLSTVSVADRNTDVNEAVRKLSTMKDFVLYDQRHFAGSHCSPEGNCCKAAAQLDFGIPIQEIVSGMVGENSPAYTEGSTVALHGFALAIILRLNPIYIIGVELPKTEAEYLSYKNWKRRNELPLQKIKRYVRLAFPKLLHRNSDFGAENYQVILNDFASLAKIANSLGIQVISLSMTSPLNEIQHIMFSVETIN